MYRKKHNSEQDKQTDSAKNNLTNATCCQNERGREMFRAR